MTDKIFNKNNTAYLTADYPLFLGQPLALYDSVHTIHPEIFSAYKELKSLDWSEDEMDLTQSRMDLKHMGPELRDFFTANLTYQWEGDSIAARSIAPLIAPFVSNSELWAAECKRSENEVLHTLTYSEIVRQCYEDPKEVFEMVMKNDNVLVRGDVIAKVFADLQNAGARYTLGIHTEDRVGLMKYIVSFYVALFALEQVEFMSSFACTFGVAQQGWMVGASRLVQKISVDEIVHARKYNVRILDALLQDPDAYSAFLSERENLRKIVDEAVQTEFDWNSYLFSEGRKVVGLTKELLDEWVRWCAQVIYDYFGFDLPFERVLKNPIPYMDDWLNIDVIQNANQESANTNYKLNSVVYTLSDDEILDF